MGATSITDLDLRRPFCRSPIFIVGTLKKELIRKQEGVEDDDEQEKEEEQEEKGEQEEED